MSAAPERKQPGRKPLPEGAGKTARIDWRVFPATKAEWQAKARFLARAQAPKVRVNVLAPGWIETSFGQHADRAFYEQVRASIADELAVQRLAQARERRLRSWISEARLQGIEAKQLLMEEPLRFWCHD